MRCRIDILTSEVLAVVKVARVGERLEFALGADAVAVAEIGERRYLDEREPFRRSRHTLVEVGDEKMVRLNAQVRVRIARIRLGDDDAFNNDRQELIVVRGKLPSSTMPGHPTLGLFQKLLDNGKKL